VKNHTNKSVNFFSDFNFSRMTLVNFIKQLKFQQTKTVIFNSYTADFTNGYFVVWQKLAYRKLESKQF
jgi:hypothetical protein